MLHAFLLTQTGIPVLYSGDEIGQKNDYSYHNDPIKCEDSRYLHRGNFNWDEAALRTDPNTRQGKLFNALRKIEEIRAEYELFDTDADAWTLDTYNDNILCIGRYYKGQKLLGLFNFGDTDQTAWINEEEDYIDLMTGKRREARAVGVPAHDFAWLFYDFNPKPVKADVQEAAPSEEKTEEPAEAPAPAKAVEVKAEAESPKKTVRKKAAKASEAAEEKPAKKTTRKKTAKAAEAAEEKPAKKTTRKKTAKAAEAAEEKPAKKTAGKKTAKAAEAAAEPAKKATKRTSKKAAEKKENGEA